MQIELSSNSLPILKALASDTRIKIIELLSEKKMNVNELARTLNMSNPVTANHVKILEHAGIIKVERFPGKAGIQKQSILQLDQLVIDFPKKNYSAYKSYEVSTPIGQYVNFFVLPTCGLASTSGPIGRFDEPKYFANPERVDAEILWFTQGFVEYKIMNPLRDNECLEAVEITMELSSEFPEGKNHWLSDISFKINNSDLGTWLSPGDFVDSRGKNNPDWWPNNINQYGLRVIIKITEKGVWINEIQTSEHTVSSLELQQILYDFKIEVKENAEHIGGCTIFGNGFGNYKHNIDFKYYFS